MFLEWNNLPGVDPDTEAIVAKSAHRLGTKFPGDLDIQIE